MPNASRLAKLASKRRHTTGRGQRNDRGTQPRDDQQGGHVQPATG